MTKMNEKLHERSCVTNETNAIKPLDIFVTSNRKLVYFNCENFETSKYVSSKTKMMTGNSTGILHYLET